MSEHLRCERHDAHEALVAQLAADGPEDAGPARLLLVIDENGGVLVEADVAAVGTPLLLLRPHDDALDDVALLDGSAGYGVLDRGHEHVTDAGVAPARPAEHADAEHLACAGVVGDPEPGFLLNHRARSNTSVRRQRFSLDRGRVSCTRTRSPTLALSSASCTYSFFVRCTVLPYLGWRTRSTTATTTVADMASDTTMPSRTLRRLFRGPSSSGASEAGSSTAASASMASRACAASSAAATASAVPASFSGVSSAIRPHPLRRRPGDRGRVPRSPPPQLQLPLGAAPPSPRARRPPPRASPGRPRARLPSEPRRRP